MILQQKKSLWHKGFSLIEVIITVSILGIFSTVTIPIINYFNKTKSNVELDRITLTLKNEFADYISSWNYNSSFKYPIVATSTTDSVGVQNMSDLNVKTFFNNLVGTSELLKSEKTKDMIVERGEISKNTYTITYTLTFKSGIKIKFILECIDNQVSYKDTGYFTEFTYYTKDNLSKTVKM